MKIYYVSRETFTIYKTENMALNIALYYSKGQNNRQNYVFYTHIPIVIHSFVRVGRIGLPSNPWQGLVLPLNYTRINSRL